MNSSNNIIWQKTIGGDKSDYLYSVEIDKNQNIYLGVGSNSGISGDKTSPFSGVSYDAWIIKTNTIGEIECQSCYSFTSLDASILTTEEDYVISGTKDGMRLIKLNSLVTTELKNNQNNQNIKIYPNPAKNSIYLEFIGIELDSISDIEINSVDGKLVFKKSISVLNGKSKIDFHLQDGIYLVKIWMKDKYYTKRVVVRN